MLKAFPTLAAIAVLAAASAPAPVSASSAAADTSGLSGQDWLKALCRRDATECTLFLLLKDTEAMIGGAPPPYTCIRKSDYAAMNTFRPDRIAALLAWWESHPDANATAEVMARRAMLAVFAETPECLAEKAAR